MTAHSWQYPERGAAIALSIGMFFRWVADNSFILTACVLCYRKGFNDGLRTGCLLEPEEVPALIDTTVEAMVA